MHVLQATPPMVGSMTKQARTHAVAELGPRVGLAEPRDEVEEREYEHVDQQQERALPREQVQRNRSLALYGLVVIVGYVL